MIPGSAASVVVDVDVDVAGDVHPPPIMTKTSTTATQRILVAYGQAEVKYVGEHTFLRIATLSRYAAAAVSGDVHSLPFDY